MTKEELKKQLEERVAKLEAEVRKQQINKAIEDKNREIENSELGHES